MTRQPYSQLVRYKQWADRGLYEVIGENLEKLEAQDAAILLRILDHMKVVDSVFQHHLRGLPHGFHAPRSADMPDFAALARDARDVDEWYVSYIDDLPEADLGKWVDFVFTSGTAGRMRRADVLLHICMHGTYHRGNAGIVLQKNGIAPNDDRMTDFLASAA